MDKFWAFRRMLDFLADYADVTDADMNYYDGCMKICGKNDGQEITITITIKDMEENKND